MTSSPALGYLPTEDSGFGRKWARRGTGLWARGPETEELPPCHYSSIGPQTHSPEAPRHPVLHLDSYPRGLSTPVGWEIPASAIFELSGFAASAGPPPSPREPRLPPPAPLHGLRVMCSGRGPWGLPTPRARLRPDEGRVAWSSIGGGWAPGLRRPPAPQGPLAQAGVSPGRRLQRHGAQAAIQSRPEGARESHPGNEGLLVEEA